MNDIKGPKDLVGDKGVQLLTSLSGIYSKVIELVAVWLERFLVAMLLFMM